MNGKLAALGVAVVALQIALAAATFDPSPHTGGDNAGYVILGYSLLERGAYLDLHDPDEPLHTKYPPVYPAVLAAAMLLGARTWTALKALSTAFIAGAVLAAFLWVERRRGPALALAVAAMLAASEAFLFHTRWILSDPLFLVLTLASLWAFTVHDEAQNGVGKGWLVAACAAAILAFFTRSAGIPLVLAIAAILALRGRRRALAGFLVAFTVPALAWWVRAQGGDPYVSEFWLVDPYQPTRGRAGVGDLLARVLGNAMEYGGRWIPGGLVGYRGGLVEALGALLLLVAAVGWWRRIRSRVGVTEVFVPLYLSLILLWPEVWAGDRFALPLYPFVLFYAGEVVLDGTRTLPGAVRRAALAAAVSLFLVPAGWVVRESALEARECRALIAREGAFACYTDAVREYVKAAEWSASNLTPESRILTRKPRLFFVLSGLKSRSYPLTRDPAEFLDEALSSGMTHTVMDYLDTLGEYYLAPVIQARAGAFCSLVGFGNPALARTEILGILPPEQWEEAAGPAIEGTDLILDLRVCAGAPRGQSGSVDPPYGGSVIPLLTRLNHRVGG